VGRDDDWDLRARLRHHSRRDGRNGDDRGEGAVQRSIHLDGICRVLIRSTPIVRCIEASSIHRSPSPSQLYCMR
jgi:hypothetical protein